MTLEAGSIQQEKWGGLMKTMKEVFDSKSAQHDSDFIARLGLVEFYDAVQNQIDQCSQKDSILVLGCGTGLEIEGIHHACRVTAVDLSPEMLEQLKAKELDSRIQLSLVCASYFDLDLGMDKYDIVLSCYSLHHFTAEQKGALYKKILACLKPDGAFINGDLVSKDVETEAQLFARAEKSYTDAGLPFGHLHIDVPLTAAHEAELCMSAGFTDFRVVRQWTRSAIMKAARSQ